MSDAVDGFDSWLCYIFLLYLVLIYGSIQTSYASEADVYKFPTWKPCEDLKTESLDWGIC